MDSSRVQAYLQRIAARRPDCLDLDALAMLEERHLDAVPFENLSIHLGEPIVLDEDALVDKIVGRRRGGFCCELNGAFGALLKALGFDVTLMAARVFGEHGGLGSPYDHMVLRVDLDQPYLVDVVFGAFSRHPLRLADRGSERTETHLESEDVVLAAYEVYFGIRLDRLPAEPAAATGVDPAEVAHDP